MSLLLTTSRAYPWTTSSVLLTRVAHQESTLLLSANQRQWSSNRANVPGTRWAKLFGPEYSSDENFQLGSRRKVGPVKNQINSFAEYFQLGSRRNIRPVKNGLYWSTVAEVFGKVSRSCLTKNVTRFGTWAANSLNSSTCLLVASP